MGLETFLNCFVLNVLCSKVKQLTGVFKKCLITQFSSDALSFRIEIFTFWLRDHPFKTLAICRGEGGVKNWSNLPMDSSKKLPTERG